MRNVAFRASIVLATLISSFSFSHAQVSWLRYQGNPVVPAGTGTPAFSHTYAPSVLFDSSSGVYKMWFSSVLPGGGTYDIWYATSINGIDWEVYGNIPVLNVGQAGSFDSRWVIDPFVLKIDSLYRMYYTGYDGIHWQTGLAVSGDGVMWTKHPGNPILRVIPGSWESVASAAPKIHYNGSSYAMLYNGFDGIHYNIGLANSPDGIQFVRYPLNPVMRQGNSGEWDASSVSTNALLHHHDTLYLLFNGGPYAPVGFASSTDNGVSWTKYAGNPVFTTGPVWAWDAGRVAHGSLMVSENQIKYWYSGYSSSDDRWQVGYATGSFAPPPVTSDTVALWHFDEASGNIVHDSSPYGNDGVATGTTIVPGRTGNARSFSGAYNYIVVPNPGTRSMNFASTQSFTIEVWFKTTQSDTGEMIRRGLAPTPGFALRILNGHVQGITGYQEPYLRITSTRSDYNDGVWHVARLVRDRSQAKLFLYVDGVPAAAPLIDNVQNAIANDRPLTMGCWENFVQPTFYRGVLDEVGIFKGALHGSTAPAIQVTPEDLTFGLVPVGTIANRVLGISNLSYYDTLEVSFLSTNPVFLASVPLSVPVKVPPGTTQHIPVSYTPTEARSDTGTLIITSNDPNKPTARISLSGRGFVFVPSPLISSIRDIPEDQGRQVRVIWYRSIYDGVNDSLHIVEYNLWRRVGNTRLWDFIGAIPAVRFEQYAYVAPTLYDSTRSGIRWSVFKVSAHTAAGVRVFFSEADSGYSVDNIPPFPPMNLTASVGAGRVTLGWTPSTDQDIEVFAVYRSTDPNFIPSEENRIGTSSVSSFLDVNVTGNPRYYYYVTAFDTAGNQSAPSNQASAFLTGVPGTGIVPTEFKLYQNFPNPCNPGSVIRYDLPEPGHVTITVYDMLGRMISTLVDEIQPAGQHTVPWHAGQMASGVYLYRMRAAEYSAVRKMLLMK